jgi:hypothetical protein
MGGEVILLGQADNTHLGRGHSVVFKVQHQNEIKYVLCLSQVPFILFTQMLATSFGLNGPSSGQYL